jgi:signal transduction histidine kinase
VSNIELLRSDRRCGCSRLSTHIVATVGHELRAPLATALLYLGITANRLGEEPTDGPIRSALALATCELRKLERLLGRVIELEREGRVVVRARPVRLDEVVREAVRSVLASGSEARRQVRLELAGSISGWWDDSAVEQIVGNLVSNALKFGEGRPVRVALEMEPTGARLTVQDHGIGIRGVDQEAIFERHVRSPADRSGGLGLGLWIVKKLAEAHGGRVTVQSRPKHGATFTVKLPQLPPGRAVPIVGRLATAAVPARRRARRDPAAQPLKTQEPPARSHV